MQPESVESTLCGCLSVFPFSKSSLGNDYDTTKHEGCEGVISKSHHAGAVGTQFPTEREN